MYYWGHLVTQPLNFVVHMAFGFVLNKFMPWWVASLLCSGYHVDQWISVADYQDMTFMEYNFQPNPDSEWGEWADIVADHIGIALEEYFEQNSEKKKQEGIKIRKRMLQLNLQLMKRQMYLRGREDEKRKKIKSEACKPKKFHP